MIAARAVRGALLPLARGEALAPPASREQAAALLAEARRQGMVAALRAAAERAPEAWPDDLRQELADRHRRQLVRGLEQIQVAAEARRRLAQDGLRCLPLKGIALAEDLYESVADRPMADVDLLVLDDFEAALACLRGAGFALEEEADHAVCLWHRRTGVRLEAHRGLASCPGLHPVDAEAWWSRRRGGPDPHGVKPSWEDLLVQMAVHAAFQHGLVLSLVQYQDLRLILERKVVDESLLAERARECQAEAALACALLAAEAVAGARVVGTSLGALTGGLPRGFRRWLERRLADPAGLLAPAAPALLRMRWALARGRRTAFVLETLRGAPPLDGDRGGSRLRRGARLVRTVAGSGSTRG